MRKISLSIILLVLVAALLSPLFISGENADVARKVNEYEGQHMTSEEDVLSKVNEYEGQHRKVNEYEGQHR